MDTSVMASNGMIATPHFLASEAGLAVLQEGGTAMDAAIAANAVLTVIYPDQTSPGGDCFFLISESSGSDVLAYNGSGPAPHAASAEALLNLGYNGMPRRGPYSVTIPGTIDAWFAGHQRFGSLDMSRLLQPAIDYARDGFPVSPRLSGAIAAQSGILPDLGYVGDVMMPNGRVPQQGDVLRFPVLAETLESIGAEGRDLFYSGWVARAITDHLSDLGGWTTFDDFASYSGEWVEPLSHDYRGTRVWQCPPNSQGITALLEFGMTGMERFAADWGAASTIHTQIEAKKRAYRVRDMHIADPRYIDVATDALLSDAFLRELWQDFSPDWTTAGQIDRAGDTVYLCVVDQNGMAVSLIQSMYQAFGSGVADPETGIILHNRGTAFWLNPDRVNVLEPGKRPLHSLMPAMLERDGVVTGLVGTQGGFAQAQIQLQLVSNVVDFGFGPQQAIDAPRWISGSADSPNDLLLERGFSQETIEGLAARGHDIIIIDPWNPGAGHAQMILIDHESGNLTGGADQRADGKVSGY